MNLVLVPMLNPEVLTLTRLCNKSVHQKNCFQKFSHVASMACQCEGVQASGNRKWHGSQKFDS